MAAMTIVVDQSKAVHSENAGSNEHQADGGVGGGMEKTDGGKMEIRMGHSCDSFMSLLKDFCNTLFFTKRCVFYTQTRCKVRRQICTALSRFQIWKLRGGSSLL